MELNKLPWEQIGCNNPLVVEQDPKRCGMHDDLKVKVPVPVSMHGPELLCLIQKTAPKIITKQVMIGNTWAEKNGVSMQMVESLAQQQYFHALQFSQDIL